MVLTHQFIQKSTFTLDFFPTMLHVLYFVPTYIIIIYCRNVVHKMRTTTVHSTWRYFGTFTSAPYRIHLETHLNLNIVRCEPLHGIVYVAALEILFHCCYKQSWVSLIRIHSSCCQEIGRGKKKKKKNISI